MSFLRNLFRRRANPPSPRAAPGDPAEAWQPGDLARCVLRVWWISETGLKHNIGPREAQVLRVVSVVLRPSGGQYLNFAAWPYAAFVSGAFVKLRPLADEQVAAEAEFIALIRRQHVPAEHPEPALSPVEGIQPCQ